MAKLGALILCVAVYGCMAQDGNTITVVPDSTTPLVQLTGEKMQYFDAGRRFDVDTPNRTLTTHDMLGTDLGVPVTFPGKTLFVFGDSWGHWRNPEGRHVWHPGWGKADCIGYIDTPFDFTKCRAIEDFGEQVAKNPDTARVDYGQSPVLKLYDDPQSKPKAPRFLAITIKNLQPGQNLGSFEVPTGAFALNDRLYMFYNVRHQEAHKPDGKRVVYFLNSILARSDQTYQEWSDKAPPTFTRLYDASSHEVLSDPLNAPSDESGAGKFIHAAPVVMDKAAIAAAGMAALLPPELQTAEKLVFIWGSSWQYVRSNLYLAVVAASDIEATVNGQRDSSKWWFCSGLTNGKPAWSHDEAAATPLIGKWAVPAPCIGEHAVIWNADLNAFVLSYQEHYIRIVMRTAPTPWGPWSDELNVFKRGDPAGQHLIHTGKDTISNHPVPILKPDGGAFVPPDNHGATYGPYMLDQTTRNPDGSSTIYFTMSTWTPYNVFLMKTTLRREVPKIQGQ